MAPYGRRTRPQHNALEDQPCDFRAFVPVKIRTNFEWIVRLTLLVLVWGPIPNRGNALRQASEVRVGTGLQVEDTVLITAQQVLSAVYRLACRGVASHPGAHNSSSPPPQRRAVTSRLYFIFGNTFPCGFLHIFLPPCGGVLDGQNRSPLILQKGNVGGLYELRHAFLGSWVRCFLSTVTAWRPALLRALCRILMRIAFLR